MADIQSPADAPSAASSRPRNPPTRRPAPAGLSAVEMPTADPQLRAACAEMESLFLYHLLQKMRATVEKTDLFGGGRSEEIYTSMLDGEVAKSISAAGGIGLSTVLLRQFVQVNGAADSQGSGD